MGRQLGWYRTHPPTPMPPAGWVKLLPRPAVHPDLASLAALPTPDERRAAAAVQVALLKRKRFADPQSSAPEKHDQRAESMTVGVTADRAHHSDDLIDRWRISRVLLALVARRATLVMTGQGRGRAAVASGVQQHGFHEFSLRWTVDGSLLLELSGRTAGRAAPYRKADPPVRVNRLCCP
jgi:hypothetical protein